MKFQVKLERYIDGETHCSVSLDGNFLDPISKYPEENKLIAQTARVLGEYLSHRASELK